MDLKTPDQPCGLPGILLAAGGSKRMGECKLLLPLQGRPLVVHSLDAALSGGLQPLVAVTGPWTPAAVVELFTHATAGYPRLSVTTAEKARLGQAESLKAGLAKVLDMEPRASGVMVLLGDQPLIKAELIRELVREFFQCRGEVMCIAPEYKGQRGHPVILPKELFPQVFALEGDTGARGLLAAFPLRVISATDDSCLTDVDTPESYVRLLRRME
jgi:molybdenum cofactor cytidylyltransferase